MPLISTFHLAQCITVFLQVVVLIYDILQGLFLSISYSRWRLVLPYSATYRRIMHVEGYKQLGRCCDRTRCKAKC